MEHSQAVKSLFAMQSNGKAGKLMIKNLTGGLGQNYSIYGSDNPCLSNLVKNLSMSQYG